MNLLNHLNAPKGTLSDLGKHSQSDIFAGLWVFMLSLPISLSVAWASGFPIISALISAIVGGLFLSFFSGLQVSIKQAGLGMTVILLLAIQKLSVYPETAYQFTLAIIILAGCLQIILGIIRFGNWHTILPETVLYGVLSAIALMIFIHQFHILIGVLPKATTTWELLIEIPNSVRLAHRPSVIIGMICLFIFAVAVSLPKHIFKPMPAVFLVILLGVLLDWWFDIYKEGEVHLAHFPSNFKEVLVFPSFDKIFTLKSLGYAFALALLCSSESLINQKYIEAQDLYRRQTNPNKELIILGVGSVICGFIGGLPLINTMDRTSKNINNNAKTRWSVFFTALFFMITLGLFLNLIAYVPTSVFASILIFMTYQLFSRKLVLHIKEIGKDRFIIFIVTLLVTLFVGILPSFLAGLLCAWAMYMILGAKFWHLFYVKAKLLQKKNKYLLNVQTSALASNFPYLKTYLHQVPLDQRLILNLEDAKVVDYSFLEQIYTFSHKFEIRGGKVEVQGLKNHRPLSHHPLATRKLMPQLTRIKQRYATSLDERQIDIQAVASINNQRLETNISYDGIVLQGFQFALGYEIKYRENKFILFYEGNTLEFSDVFLSKGIRLSEDSHHTSVLLATVMTTQIPDFSLTKENFLEKVFQRIGYEDIDFEEYPEFSENYALKGENPEHIRNFFSTELITFLTKNKGYNVESNNNRLLFYKNLDLMTKVEIEDTIYFAEEFLDILVGKTIEVI